MNGSIGSLPTWWWLSAVVLVGAGATLVRSRSEPSRPSVRRGAAAGRGVAVVAVTLAAVMFSLGTAVDG